MYVFISYSSHDRVFVRRLADSLAYYPVPLFLDEREIKVGNNIPSKVYDALEGATHVIFVLSNHSIDSKWAKEEMSVAKMRQLDNKGCHILPVLIDDVAPPASVAHVKYADFRHWEIKESYLQALQDLLTALAVEPSYASSAELRFLRQNLSELVKLLLVANTAMQEYHRLGEDWFEAFNGEPSNLARWLQFRVQRLWDWQGFLEAYRVFQEGYASIDTGADKISQVLSLCDRLQDDVSYWIGHRYKNDDKEVAGDMLWFQEGTARRLFALLYSMILELQ